MTYISSDRITLNDFGKWRFRSRQSIQERSQASSFVDGQPESMTVNVCGTTALTEPFEAKGEIGRCRVIHS
jgi:hypothetical protein